MSDINKVAVIGAGVMGAGIAAHVANAGVPVVLLDTVPDGSKDRNTIANKALAMLQRAKPAAFMKKSSVRKIIPGNIDDDLAMLNDCDWIIEAVTERLDTKHTIYEKINAHRKPGSIVSSNTSTIPLEMLTSGMGDTFASDFMVTHFFNPPRYMPLLEVVTSDKTRQDATETVTSFCDLRLGKGVVKCNDRPGFIANRLGVFWGLTATNAAIELNLAVEEADALMSKPLGIPKTGIFGMTDLVGLDLMPLVAKSLAGTLPKDDPFHAVSTPQPLLERMIAAGNTGRKAKAGFYRISRAAGKVKEAVDLQTGEYRPQITPDIPVLKAAFSNPLLLIDDNSKYGIFFRRVVLDTLTYAANLVGDAADSIEAIDEAMRLGYNWTFGPFQLIDRIGVDAFIERLEEERRDVPGILRAAQGRSIYAVHDGKQKVLDADGTFKDLARAEGVVLLEDVKLASKPVLKNDVASLWDLGDGVACFEITTYMNALDQEVLQQLELSLQEVERAFKALVIYTDGPNFSVGANLAKVNAALEGGQTIDDMVSYGQQIMIKMRDSRFPVVAAPAGMTLGGGCELALHANAIQAHAECYMGLVEVGVGLIPGWGGCKEVLARLSSSKSMPRGPMPATMKAFEMISTAKVSSSAEEAKEMCYLRPSDGITMNRARLLSDAKAKALALVGTYTPADPPVFHLAGSSGRSLMVSHAQSMARMGVATEYDVTICEKLARVLTGGDTDPIDMLDEQRVLDLEKGAFLALLAEPNSRARIAYMMETGKPLRN
ncbi:3-hydroxyacyl-CoA dehydrogenase [Roseibium hamelinense]|uniref:3-hydroxyacyl-CoA dehydrogenase n=1 Tax=Roseibium hamelinense TaxID=150831 RepID=A0A562SBI2_9HYPH|nr:3-hydroxyacyl-CoA dehydrogenase/enoyl-CoA hydratase family protein [Roseibium hamelinense]MTI42165.1 3-hydroxyacyl-CoA dehydrogenase/enoyl-CoA hydratase family protein [Roseibium hamelinense]TWI78725.1 3-hydroxyacyl-CoA dehydrogenase [Roseibium hamelinense]